MNHLNANVIIKYRLWKIKLKILIINVDKKIFLSKKYSKSQMKKKIQEIKSTTTFPWKISEIQAKNDGRWWNDPMIFSVWQHARYHTRLWFSFMRFFMLLILHIQRRQWRGGRGGWSAFLVTRERERKRTTSHTHTHTHTHSHTNTHNTLTLEGLNPLQSTTHIHTHTQNRVSYELAPPYRRRRKWLLTERHRRRRAGGSRRGGRGRTTGGERGGGEP